jgi:trehalose 6-phosphate synthase/phosphatase
MVTSLDDGMNLVAKEYAASRVDEDGTLVLSGFTGAAKELTTALLVNPFSVDEMSGALYSALTMPREERGRRMRALRKVVRENNIYTWGAHFMRTLLDGDGLARRGSLTRTFALASGL